MFTGLVTNIGTVSAFNASSKGAHIVVTHSIENTEFVVSDSIACSGVCLTLINISSHSFSVEVSTETLATTNISQWSVGTKINLEPSLKLGDSIGGHLVLGHVDGVAGLISRIKDGNSERLLIELNNDLAPYIAKKGSITIDGVSLTVNNISLSEFDVNIIPHTLATTTLKDVNVGALLNVEVDPIARYVNRMHEAAK